MFIGRVISGAKIEDMPFFIEVTDEVSDFSIPTFSGDGGMRKVT